VSVSHAFAQRLAGGAPIPEPVALVVAHADDETLWAGAALPRLSRLTLVHLTDSAPADMADAGRLGFATRADYARARADELEVALAALDAKPDRIAYGLPDKEAAAHLPDLVARLAHDLRDAVAILTHPYEGGHPDHDTAALAVRAAADRIGGRTGRRPSLAEFACYHQQAGARRFGHFWPDPDCPEQVRPLDPDERGRVARAIAAHGSQAAVIDGWCPQAERWRAAPAYDFTAPPPPGASLYDGFGWSITSGRWRRLAEAVAACA
jgi:LmbE family N-acetylglucosaminyl deacetylase